MINDNTILAIIPARGGSKEIPRKNIKPLADKPLIAWTIEEAKKSIYIDRLILSSEDEEIIKIAREYGCEVPFVRPLELAKDEISGIEPVIHAIKSINKQYDYVILLQPTSPLRNSEDIDASLKLCISYNYKACVSVVNVSQHPYLMHSVNKKNELTSFIKNTGKISRRQELPILYILNGAIFIANIKWLLKSKNFIYKNTLAFKMEKDKSIDIDNEIDFFIAEQLLKKNSF